MTEKTSLIDNVPVAIRLICLVAYIGACGDSPTAEVLAYQNAPQNYRCTSEEMLRVTEETMFCENNGGYSKVYCYGTAIIRNCTDPHAEPSKPAPRTPVPPPAPKAGDSHVESCPSGWKLVHYCYAPDQATGFLKP